MQTTTMIEELEAGLAAKAAGIEVEPKPKKERRSSTVSPAPRRKSIPATGEQRSKSVPRKK